MSFRFVAPIHPREPSSGALPKRTKRSAACTACKARRSRCGGGYPCDRCLESGSECVFGGLDRRRKCAQRRMEQELDTVQRQLDEIVEAFDNRGYDQLGKIVDRVKEQRAGSGGRQRDQEIAGNCATSNGVQSDPRVFRDTRRFSSPSSSSTSSVGSLDEVDVLTEDPNRTEESRAAGYIGKESEIAWMQKLEIEACKMEGGQETEIEESIVSMSYHVDNLSLSDPAHIDPRLLPPQPWAERLVKIYFGSIAPSFPLLNRTLFMAQFEAAYSSSAYPTNKWLAVLNLVFAISAKYYQLAEPIAGRDVDDRVFLSRASCLRSPHHLVLDHADLHQVQIDLLLAIYFLALGQVNRSWRVNGSAARSALCLGLNLRAFSEHIDPVSKETRTRIWWTIFSLEHLLSGMTGRVPCLDHRSMSLYPPVPYDEDDFDHPELKTILGMTDQREKRLHFTVYATDEELAARTAWLRSIEPNGSLFFFHLVDLSIITHAAVMAIYSLQSTRESHSGRGQSEIPHYQSMLQSWVSNLHPAFAFTDKDKEPSLSRDSRAQVGLALSYYSSQIILSRPCLTRPDLKEGTNIRFARSRFGNNTARTCVHSALSLIFVLPDEPDATWMLKKSPWWCILHYIMQALTVLLIQTSIGFVPDDVTKHTRKGHEAEESNRDQNEGNTPEAIWNASKKALNWLHCMADLDPSWRRAFEISEGFVRRIAKAKDLDMDLLPGIRQEPQIHGSVYRGPGNEMGGGESTRKRSLSSGLLRQEPMNWGPDCTMSEGDYEQEHQQHPFVLDPTLFSVGM
ncbi:Zn(II)2Cys6 transcription factor [Aspergillus foveolatus]|uniref:Zn(II)2Cys6 transcription factor n=1 Tax=Aspergillus foveolatus TaxID=210207 RepID=UPI003CCD50B6